MKKSKVIFHKSHFLFDKFLFNDEYIISYFYEYFNRLLDIHPYLWYNNCVEYLSPEAEHRSVQLPD